MSELPRQAVLPASAGVPSEKSAPGADARALYQTFNALRPDGEKVYEVKGLNLIHDVVHLTLDEGKLAFYQPLDGRITGAVFLGRGHVIATPHDSGERRSLAQYVGVPILDQTFTRAYLRFDDDTATELLTILQNDGAAVASDPDFSANWASIVTSLNPWHSLRLLMDWLSTDPQPYFYAALAGDSRGAFDVLVDNRREEQVVFGQPRTENGAILYDVWASFRGESADTNSTDTPVRPAFVPLDYRVDTAIADDLSLEGTTSLHLKVARAGERVIPLELSKNLAIEQVSGPDGKALEFFQNADLSQREVMQRGNDTVLAVLPAASQAGEELRLEVKYRGDVIADVGNGVEFVGERGTWYAHSPEENFCSFDLNFRWPKKFMLVATGTQIESHDDANFKAGHWKSQEPMAVAGFNLGEYDTETAGPGHPTIQLFANRQLESAILARIAQNESAIAAVTQQGPGAPATPVASPFGAGGPVPSPSSVLRNLGADVSDSIQFFEKFNGPFPFDRLQISQIPGSFGQGWPGLVYLSTLAFLPPETEQRAGIGTEEQEEARELMPFHEIAHQWWGNVTGSPGYRDDWIQEGVANYLAILYAESRNPSKHRLTTWLERYRTALLRKEAGADHTADEAGPLDLGIRLSSSKTPNAYVRVTYGKGTWVMHMLREMLREPASKDPDARFRQLLQTVLTDYRYRTLSTADFEREIEKVMPPAMDLEGNHSMKWFFDEWVRETGIPHYAVQFQAKARKEEFLITAKLEQSEVRDDFTAPIPIYAVRGGQKPELLGVVVTTGPETRFQFVSHMRPTRLVADPQLTVLHRPN